MLVKDGVGKAAHQRPAIGLVDDRVHLRGATDGLNARINAAQELFSQTRPSTLIPALGIRNILLGLGGYDQFSGHSGCGAFV